MARTPSSIAVVLVTHNSAAHVRPTLAAVREQLDELDELVVVDNASEDETPEAVRSAAPDAHLISLGENVGFAAGCNAGAAASSAPLILFLNPDALPAPGCLDALRRAGVERPEWAFWQPLVTFPGGRRVNTSGGFVHFLGFGWAGACGEPISSGPAGPQEVPFASGAALAVRRGDWERLGGFEPSYFMYGEDLDLSLRAWLAGRGVGIEPTARVEHEYEFAKGRRKWFLLERNRWWTLVSTYPAPLLAMIAPALAAAELALLLVALRGGWLRAKLRAQAAVVRELPAIVRRRRTVQATRRVSAAAFASRLGAQLDSPYLGRLATVAPVRLLQSLYWRLVVRLLPS